jgi:tetratricopeptide (TPR) repeat protein
MMVEAGEATMIQDISRIDYLLTEQRVLVTYLRLLVFPVGQSFDYNYPIYHSFLEPPVCLSFLFLLSIFGLGLYLLHRSRVAKQGSDFGVRSSEIHSSLITHHSLRLIAFGIFWFFLTLSVESSIIPLHVIFEHRVYLPSTGAFIAVSTAASIFSRRGKGKKAFMAVAMIVITFSAATYVRNEVWRTEISLWEDAVRKYPLNVRAYSNLSDAYHVKGMLDEAVQSYIKAIALAPDAPQAHNNLALVYIEKGMVEKAVEHYKEALRLDPENPHRHTRLGNAYMEMEMAEKAVKHFETAVSLNPDDASAHNKLGVVYQSRGLLDKAIEHYRLAAEIEPRDPTGYFNLGNVYQSRGLLDNAIQLYQIALKVDPDCAEAHGNLGVAYQSKGMTDKAIKHYLAALELNPDYAEAHFNLGLVYFQQGLTKKAREEFEEALRIDPGYSRARESLSRLNEN